MSHHRYRNGRDRPTIDPHDAATGLGWFSLALGAAELLAPHAFARALGLSGSQATIRAYGAREVLAGVGLLTARDQGPWMWGRVAGDALDLATLATRLGPSNPRRRTAAVALAAVAGITALDLYAAGQIAAGRDRGHGPGYGGIDADGEWDWEPAVAAEGERAARGAEVWETRPGA